MKRLARCSITSAIAMFCVVTAIASPAQTFTVLASFNGQDGDGPDVPLVQGPNGNFYGTTSYGGAHNDKEICTGYGCGTVFEITRAGKLTTIYNFCSQNNCGDGAIPTGLMLGINGNFYGTTQAGGANGYSQWCINYLACGTVFEMTPAGKLTTLYSFCGQTNCGDGGYPRGLVQAADGNLYGATLSGGQPNGDAGCPAGCGTIFKITPRGKLTTLYRFCPQDGECPTGAFPESVMQASNGNFYGVAFYGGANQAGTVFEMTSAGKVVALHSFTGGADGGLPQGMLIQATNGNLYGTTAYKNYGTVFELTPSGKLTTLYEFCSQTNCTDGGMPIAGVVQGTDGNFYGTTEIGGTSHAWPCGDSGCGTAFEITPGGKLTTLYSFCSQTNCTDGVFPFAALMQATNGTFYGVTRNGGAQYQGCFVGYGCGEVFSLSMGLGPFVETNPTSGKVGAAVTILGTNLTGATSVTFHGTAAKFKVISKSEIKTHVPSGATTGTVKVKTTKTTLKSNMMFRVTK